MVLRHTLRRKKCTGPLFSRPPFTLTLFTNPTSNLRSTVENFGNLTASLQYSILKFENIRSTDVKKILAKEAKGFKYCIGNPT
jgi:hypothetical protein